MAPPSTIYPKLNAQDVDANTSIQEDEDVSGEDNRGTIMTDGSRQFMGPNGNNLKPNKELLNSAPMNVSPKIKEKQIAFQGTATQPITTNTNSQDISDG